MDVFGDKAGGKDNVIICIYFSYRENNEVAGHTAASGREPIEQGVGRYLQAQEVPISVS